MKNQNALTLLARVMNWGDTQEALEAPLMSLQLMAGYKYDYYQRFSPGRMFIESLALWLNQFPAEQRKDALDLISKKLVFVSNKEFTHLVGIAYQDIILQERIRLVGEEEEIPSYMVGKISSQRRFRELGCRSLYLGLSDGARTNELRRASDGEIGNEQIWQAYELSDEKANDMVQSLSETLKTEGFDDSAAKFNVIWLIDDFSASGNTYVRFASEQKKYKGKVKKIYERLSKGDLVDKQHYEVFLLLYMATRQAIDHIEYWAERFTAENGYKPLRVKVVHVIESDVSLKNTNDESLRNLINYEDNYDERASDKHVKVGGTEHVRWGFAECALPIVLEHNTPNNSIYLLWGPEQFQPRGLFPRVSRHREF